MGKIDVDGGRFFEDGMRRGRGGRKGVFLPCDKEARGFLAFAACLSGNRRDPDLVLSVGGVQWGGLNNARFWCGVRRVLSGCGKPNTK